MGRGVERVVEESRERSRGDKAGHEHMEREGNGDRTEQGQEGERVMLVIFKENMTISMLAPMRCFPPKNRA